MTNFIERFFPKKETRGPVSLEFKNLRDFERKFPERFLRNEYAYKLQGYLEFALQCGLDDDLILLSCYDLATTLDPFFFCYERRKEEPWKEKQAFYASIVRGPRMVEMKLNPSYFAAIASGVKKYEGRAYDPLSDKRYEDLRSGDQIVFAINQDITDVEGECSRFELKVDSKMICTVGDVYFSPTVHGMFEFCPPIGAEFQPMIKGMSEFLQLQRAGVYYSFAGYPERISKFGFLGIEMLNPEII